MNSSIMGRLLTTKLREDALILRRLAATSASSVHTAKAKMLQEIHLILTIMLGPPPNPRKAFTWEFYDKDDKFQSIKTTPLDFAASLSSSTALRSNSGVDVNTLFSLVNDPRNDYGTLLTVSRLGNVKEGRGIRYVNVPMHTMKEAVISMLKAGFPVFFGCDVGKYSASGPGIMDTDLINYELAFNIKLGMDKAQRVMTGESAMTHAMVLTAVHIVDGKPVRWRVENSWGETAGSAGYFVMTDAWMDQFVYQVCYISISIIFDLGPIGMVIRWIDLFFFFFFFFFLDIYLLLIMPKTILVLTVSTYWLVCFDFVSTMIFELTGDSHRL
jgi:bleomycin hydrolase